MFPHRTALALKFALRLNVEWQGERGRSTRGISIIALEDLKRAVDKHVDHMPDSHTNGWLLLNIHMMDDSRHYEHKEKVSSMKQNGVNAGVQLLPLMPEWFVI